MDGKTERIWTLSELNAVREKRPYTTYGGWDERGLETPHAPYRNPVHFVLQAGVNEHILERMGEDPIKDGFEWARTILFRPVMFPGIHPQFK